jgi:hypothetical protein
VAIGGAVAGTAPRVTSHDHQSCRIPVNASLAQSVERETLNLKVAGSTPAWGLVESSFALQVKGVFWACWAVSRAASGRAWVFLVLVCGEKGVVSAFWVV